MSGLTQVINTGWTGLATASQALETVSNNTANVNTAGYDVESVQQVESPDLPNGVGTGATVSSIQRAYDAYVFAQMVGATSVNQAAQVQQQSAQNLSAIFPVASGGAGGLGALLTSFFTAMNAVSQDPTSLSDRQNLLDTAQSLAADFNSVGGQLSSNLTALNGQMTNAVAQVNTLTQQIAALNQQIMSQSAAGTAGAPNQLEDERDNLVQQLAQQLGVTVVDGPNNGVDVYTAGGAVLVDGGSSATLTATSGSYGGGLSIIYQPTGQNITASLSGGTIGGLIGAQLQVTAAQNSVGGLAAALAAAVNTQQSLGLDLNGASGAALFSVAGPSVAAAAGNTGSGTLSATITNGDAFTPANYIVTKTASGYEATDLATGQSSALGSGPTLSLDGMTLAVSGTINTGDSFEVEPTALAAQSLRVSLTDPSGIAAASPYVATAGSNLGNVTAGAFSPAASGALPPGTAIVPASYFGQDLTVKFTSSTTFNILSAGNAVIASGSYSAATGAEIAIDYPSTAPAGEVAAVALSAGTPAAGDSFALTPGGVADNGNIAAMTALAGDNLLSGQTLSGAYATLVGEVGSAGQSANFAASASQGVLNQVQAVQQSISGVNLDEQAADLISYQQAYQASAQVIATAQSLFQSLIASLQAA
ncbi:MAG TPA: flagellar hook-associated protein FlgK [Stellaceae bacterium]|nr:flagellar hook-associated protein FlgK [Stellaceae bacterium]